jgi:DMSO/TMAO reductase YedYZ molybdopterin-dependent catalytic subunit
MRASRKTELPPGQRERADFPRFGLLAFATRFPRLPNQRTISIRFENGDPIDVTWEELPRIAVTEDFHCVTTWSKCRVAWSGFRFRDFWERVIAPRFPEATTATTAVLRGQDGYRTTVLLEDLLSFDVLLADQLDGKPLSIDHGAPVRIVMPRHYGYKSVKHLSRIELWRKPPPVHAAFAFMDHPRARVAFEERGRSVPGILLRYLYRPLVAPARWWFARAHSNRRSE